MFPVSSSNGVVFASDDLSSHGNDIRSTDSLQVMDVKGISTDSLQVMDVKGISALRA